MANDQPVTRKERFLAGAAGEDITLDTPITREERFLAKAAGMDVKTDDPVTRSEKYLAKIAEGGGGGGGDIPSYTGAYTVTPSESTQTLATKDKKATDNITVNPIPSQYVVPQGTKSISANGTSIDVAAFSSVDVAVPVSSGGVREYVFAVSPSIVSQTVRTDKYNVDFESNGQFYDSIEIKSEVNNVQAGGIYYCAGNAKTLVYSISNSWGEIDTSYRKIKISGGDDANNATLLSFLTRIDDWQEPASFYEDAMYLYLDIPIDDYNIFISLTHPAGYSGTVYCGDGSASFSLNQHPNGGFPYTFEFSGKYVMRIQASYGLFKASTSRTTNILGGNSMSQSLRRLRLTSTGAFIRNDTTYPSDGAFAGCYSLVSVDNLNIYSYYSFRYNSIENAEIVKRTGFDNIGESAFEYCRFLKNIKIPAGITTIESKAFKGCIRAKKFRFEDATPPAVANSDSFADVPTTCEFYVPSSALAAYLTATNYPSPSTYTYIGFGTFEDGATLKTEDTTASYALTWYATKEDAIAQTNPITVGNGNEVYCRYTAV